MLQSLVLESLSGIHFSIETTENVVGIVTELIEAHVDREVRLAVGEIEKVGCPEETVSRQVTQPVDQPESWKELATDPEEPERPRARAGN